MNLSMEQKDSQRTDLCLPRGREGLGIWDEQMQTVKYRMINDKILLYSTGNYVQ